MGGAATAAAHHTHPVEWSGLTKATQRRNYIATRKQSHESIGRQLMAGLTTLAAHRCGIWHGYAYAPAVTAGYPAAVGRPLSAVAVPPTCAPIASFWF